MKKRGQITIFVLLGLFVIAIIVILLMLRSDIFSTNIGGEEGSRFLEPQINPIKERVRDCVEDSAKKGEKLIAIQGGYLDPPYYVQLGNYSVSYGCKLSENSYFTTLPLMMQVEGELAEYMALDEVQDEMNECFNFKDFKKEGFDVTAKEDATTNFDVGFSEVTVKIDYPMTINKEDYTTDVENLVLQYFSGLGKAHYVASKIVNDECRNVKFDIPTFTLTNPSLAVIERQEEDDDLGHNTYYYLTTIPEKNEDELEFHFVVEER